PGTAFLIYTGALSNSGVTLGSYRADGSLEDQVAGGENWDTIGGDNVTKETAQYSSNGWLTGDATPGSVNVTTEAVEDDEDTAKESTSGSLSRGKVVQSTSLTLPDHTLALAVSGPTIGYVNQPVAFTAEASGIGDTLINSLRYQWNFGDLHTDSGKAVSHHYTYPGEYVVHLSAGYARHEAALLHTITILPTALSLARSPAGDVLVHNNAAYEFDLSNFKIVGNSTGVEFPEHTILLPKQTLTIPHDRIGFSSAYLFDAMNTIVAQETPEEIVMLRDEVPEATVVSLASTPRSNTAITSTAPVSFGVESEDEPMLAIAPRVEAAAPLEITSDAPSPQTRPWSIFALIGLLSAAVVALYITRSKEESLS
ncbi:MAG: PKD domain-containing protein, partial [Bacteroidota bacterium]